MRFWQLSEPDYAGDYQRSYVNGLVEHPYRLPFVDCNTCGERFLADHMLPYECSPSLKEAFFEPEGVTIQEFDKIAEPVRAALQKLDVRKETVQPNCFLLPSFLEARSKELVMTESMWTGLDIFILETTRIILVTDKLKQELERIAPTNINFVEFPSSK